ncbi:MAG: NfeD family protein [Pseudomonadota bacterium]
MSASMLQAVSDWINGALAAAVWNEFGLAALLCAAAYVIASVWPGVIHIGHIVRPPKHRLGDEMRRARAVVDEWKPGAREGYVVADGERWRARSTEPLSRGDAVAVASMDGLTLKVRRKK